MLFPGSFVLSLPNREGSQLLKLEQKPSLFTVALCIGKMVLKSIFVPNTVHSKLLFKTSMDTIPSKCAHAIDRSFVSCVTAIILRGPTMLGICTFASQKAPCMAGKASNRVGKAGGKLPLLEGICRKGGRGLHVRRRRRRRQRRRAREKEASPEIRGRGAPAIGGEGAGDG